MNVDFPVTYIVHHLSNIRSMGMAAIRNANPITRPSKLPPLPVHLDQKVGAISESLVSSYVKWSGAAESRYATELPPHFCSHWAMPMLANLGSLAPYNLLALLNQGVRMEIHKPLQRGKPIKLSGSLMDVTKEPDRVRIHTQVRAHTDKGELAMVIDSYSTVPQGKPKKKSGDAKAKPQEEFTTVGTWGAEENDGLNFAMLTGDFNPIHTIPAVGKRTRFKSLILHGFGQLARTWECVLNAGHTIGDLDVRWIKPLVMPSHNLQVQVGSQPDAQGWRALRLLAQDGSVHMVGRFHAQPQAKEQGA